MCVLPSALTRADTTAQDRDIGQTAFPILLQGLLDQGTLRAKAGELFEGPDLLATVKRAAKALAEAPGKDKIVIKVQ
jgi:hypothetical protein